MDSLDVKILRLLLQGQALSPVNPDFRESLAAIAKKLGADQSTVRYKVKKLHETGFLGDWHLVVNPRFWGGGQIMVFLDVDPASCRNDMVAKLKLVPGVTIVGFSIGGLSVILDYDDEISVPRRIELIRRLSTSAEVSVARIPLPECRTVLSPSDWDLIRVLRRNPRESYSALAREVGVSSRTAKRKLSRMISEGIIFAWPSLNPQGVQGSVLAFLLVFYASELKNDIDDRIMKHLDSYVWHVVHMLPYNHSEYQPCGFNLAVPNVSMAREIQSWASGIPGVQKARVDLNEGILSFFDSYDEELDRRLRQMPAVLSRKDVSEQRESPLLIEQT